MKRLIASLFIIITAAALPALAADPVPADRPNILWITCEDISANIGCYGDDYAVTPNIDALAKQGVRYTYAFAPIGVCAPARSCLITGMYPNALGSQHMRSKGNFPEYVRGYSEYLRNAGYYCTNNSKTDYNWNHPRSTWDESSNKAHWRNRPDKDQPFFAIFNITICHESQIRIGEQQYQRRMQQYNITPHDHAKAPVPPYHPDTPESRQDWARYADMITAMDAEAGKVLKQLEEDGLAENTIVFFYSDHGAGMPRSKRWLYDSSTRVPLVIRFPEKWRHLSPDQGKPGSVTDRLVSFVDFGPTALSVAGVEVPDHMHGKPFLGKQAAEPRDYVHGYRDRMDERYDMIRSVRDKRYRYIRNFMPHRPWFGPSQYISYMYQMPTMRVWQQMYDDGKLEPVQAKWFEAKPVEELYDTQADPHEINNLANDPKHARTLERMRGELKSWMFEIRDIGLLPESQMHTRFGDKPPYQAVRDEPGSYAMQQIYDAATAATSPDARAAALLASLSQNDDPAVRYWAAVGINAKTQAGKPFGEANAGALKKHLSDADAEVRLQLAEALAKLGETEAAMPVLIDGMKDKNEWVRLRAANILDRLDEQVNAEARKMLQQAKNDKNGYVVRVVGKALSDLE